MKLTNVRVDHFRNILDSGDVAIEADVTCLVGKNESGKSSFLGAVHRLNPSIKTELDVHSQYPAWLEKRHRIEGKDPRAVTPISATFQLDSHDRDALEQRFGTPGKGVTEFTASRAYSGDLTIEVAFDEAAWVQHFIQALDVPDLDLGEPPPTVDELATVLDERSTTPPEAEQQDLRSAFGAAKKALTQAAGTDLNVHAKVKQVLQDRMPKFLHFDNYSSLPGVLDIGRIATASYDSLSPGEQTAKALLEIASADTAIATGTNYQRRKRELENTANALTQEVLDYWTQNTDIRVEIDFNQRASPNNQPVVHELHVRLYDNAHMLSLPFDERSSGFRWFFSFLCAFSRYRLSGEPVIILLDEPALGLHARAQRDFLRYIDEKLAPKCQVVYTTHSPFMVPPERLDRVRLVEDKGRRLGATVSADVMSTDKDTLFPLQGALGYDLAQSLFVGPNNLLVEGTSDYTYLQLMSSHLSGLGRSGLDDRWTIVPVGGADQVATFVALLAQHVEATVLLDSHPRGNPRMDRLVQQGVFRRSRVIGVGEVTGQREADIEDLFDPEEYLSLYNAAFGKEVKLTDLNGTDPIVKRLARHMEVPRFDHGRPAEVLLRDHAQRLPQLSEETRERFELLFAKINATLVE